ncbi:hypothetical protein [Zhenpiania hominis]|uniref:Uncharacterized protein n=1 Tax=Zhenpiania hominis TaxID=2763644 RepID=A0A923NPV0_9FIRM|nr:hypothetical protein [Zhenpiania hominis]MBC6680884.1 hypothetical protein [Zhenpiania hominis]
MEYIKWLSPDDWALGIHLKRMDALLNHYTDESEYTDINEIIELYVVCKYIDSEIFPAIWSESQLEKNKAIIKKLKGIIGKFFNCIRQEQFAALYGNIVYQYKKMFWEAFSLYKLFNKFDYTIISNAINNEQNGIWNILHEKDIVVAYGVDIRNELMLEENAAEWLLDEYEVHHSFKNERLYFPKELTLEDKKEIIKKYILYEESDLNYLRLIANIQDNPDSLVIGDKVRLQARKKVQIQEKKLFSNGTGIKTEITVIFTKMETDDPEVNVDLHNISCKYNINWIRENLDEPTLLNNFIYLFGYLDSQGRITLVEKDIYKGVVEKFLFMRSRYAYEPGYSASTLNLLADLQMAGYYQQLKENNIYLETVLKWFFEKYLKEEFSIDNFRMNTPSESTTYLEKCRTLLSEMDGVLKQYNLFVEDGYIDQELFQMSSSHMKFNDCSSAVKEKYVYGTGEIFRTACHHLFSDQSIIAHVERIDKTYDSFYDLLTNEVIYDDDFNDFTKRIIDWLIENKFIIIDNHEIKFNNLDRIQLLRQLNDNEVISFWHLSEKLRETLKIMESEGIVIFRSSLFSKHEADYFDFYLNKATFNNGNDLRNMYLHGSQPNALEDEKIHEKNYWIILKLFVLCVLKINDDLNLLERTKAIFNEW